jgi:hypothetical protein
MERLRGREVQIYWNTTIIQEIAATLLIKLARTREIEAFDVHIAKARGIKTSSGQHGTKRTSKTWHKIAPFGATRTTF